MQGQDHTGRIASGISDESGTGNAIGVEGGHAVDRFFQEARGLVFLPVPLLEFHSGEAEGSAGVDHASARPDHLGSERDRFRFPRGKEDKLAVLQTTFTARRVPPKGDPQPVVMLQDLADFLSDRAGVSKQPDLYRRLHGSPIMSRIFVRSASRPASERTRMNIVFSPAIVPTTSSQSARSMDSQTPCA